MPQRQRKKVEALFAELKSHIGLRRLRLRRLKVRPRAVLPGGYRTEHQTSGPVPQPANNTTNPCHRLGGREENTPSLPHTNQPQNTEKGTDFFNTHAIMHSPSLGLRVSTGLVSRARFSAFGRNVYTSSCGVDNSPRFDTKSVVYRYSQTLLAATYSVRWFGQRHAREEIGSARARPRIMAETRTGRPEIMWRETWNVHARGSLLDNVPDRLF
jgi:hypothetical protein